MEKEAISLRERNRQRTKEDIRQAAMALFAGQGYAATTTEHIAAAAGVSPSTLFRYFPTKSDIPFGRHDATVRLFEAKLNDAGNQASMDRIKHAVRAVIEDDPELVELVSSDPDLRARGRELIGDFEQVLGRHLVQQWGWPETTARLTAAALFGAIREVPTLVHERPEQTADELYDHAVAIIREPQDGHLATGHSPHACAFFNDPDEAYGTLLPIIGEGFDHREKAVHIVDPEFRDDHLRRLEEAHIDVETALKEGRLDVRVWPDTYLRNGRFDQGAMSDLIGEVLDESRRDGFPQTRLVAHMEWALQDAPGVQDLVEYEARMNYILPKYKDQVIWSYSLAKFGAGTVIDILRTHPMVIMGGKLRDNPFYVPPTEFLEELQAR